MNSPRIWRGAAPTALINSHDHGIGDAQAGHQQSYQPHRAQHGLHDEDTPVGHVQHHFHRTYLKPLLFQIIQQSGGRIEGGGVNGQGIVALGLQQLGIVVPPRLEGQLIAEAKPNPSPAVEHTHHSEWEGDRLAPGSMKYQFHFLPDQSLIIINVHFLQQTGAQGDVTRFVRLYLPAGYRFGGRGKGLSRILVVCVPNPDTDLMVINPQAYVH